VTALGKFVAALARVLVLFILVIVLAGGVAWWLGLTARVVVEGFSWGWGLLP
jgi:hypothetical protein